ncbi:hypothetical protein K438DRAFT_1784779 [Mycena galopus ATCC 62051]|nr:hypothetical protein K438DRAFT_1784779 [Mycena galopus ATCC 62051]
MVELIWKFMATFRNRCKELAREIVKTEYRAAIFPDQAQYRGRDEWVEKVKSNVEKLLEGSSYTNMFRQTIEEWRTGVFVTGQLREAYYQGYYLRGLDILEELETYPDLWDNTTNEWDRWARTAGFQGKKKTGRRAVAAKEMRLRLN